MSDRKTVEKVVEMYEDSMADWERGLPDLVRCKDCVYWNQLPGTVFGKCKMFNIGPGGDFFCAEGLTRNE